MIEFLGSLPTLFGGFVMMLITTLSGLIVYMVSYKFIAKYLRGDLKDAVGSLFRVVSILVSLMLALAFSEVITERQVVEKAIEREAVAISDIFTALHHYDDQRAVEIQRVLVDYAHSVVDDEWPALANDHLGPRTNALKQKFTEALLELNPVGRVQEKVWSAILADVDAVSDNRLTRLDGALSKPPVYINVVFLGFLITMVFFGAYRPEPVLVALSSLYTLFVGLVLYLIIALSDPFEGGMAIEPTTFHLMAETLASGLQ
jgi:hypothetical protein